MAWLGRLMAAFAVLTCGSTPMATALPPGHWIPGNVVAGNDSAHPFVDFPGVIKARQDDGLQLRILPLGASIMSGQGSPEHSGIRKWVRMALRNDGWDVNMVGTKQDGSDMKDMDHEATPGALIDQIRGYLQRSLPYKPNIVMINGGTNNALGGKDADKSYEIMDGILNDIWGYPDMGETCVILSTLLPGDYNDEALLRKLRIGATYRRLVTDYRNKKCIYLADTDPVGSPNTFLDVNGPYWTDDIHPNNEGHRRVAYIFYAAIHRALAAGKVKKAAPKESQDRSGCDKKFGNGIYAGETLLMARLSVNQGDGSGDTPPTFKDAGLIKTSEGKQSRVRLADIDGDGRGDYGIIGDDGKIRFWRNGWVDDVPKFWQYLGVRSSLNSGESGDTHADGVRFEDINGDGRDDSLWLDVAGMTTTYTNARSCQAGKEGDGLNVAWRQGFQNGKTSGPTHGGMGLWRVDHEYNDLRSRIFFARIYGTKPAFGNLGVQDYVFVVPEQINDKIKFKLWVWKNTGSGGTKLIADGNKYCNMMGHSSGAMDYVWTWSDGRMHLFPNAGKTQLSGGESFWGGSPGEIWNPGENLDRRDLHLADWDDDGDCDIIYVNPDNGNIRVWINDYPTKNTWDGAFREISAPKLSCNERRGIGIHDLAVRFADLTGNGRADYLCIAKDGLVRGSIHNDDDSFTDVGQIKFSEEKDRANLRWADVNGNGKDDMIWIDKLNGNGVAYYNGGRGNPDELSGSSFAWRSSGDPVYEGNHAGTCMYYPDLDGNGRADMHSIKGTWTNEAETWFNPSCGLRDVEGDDPEGVVDPKLPVQPGNPLDGPGPGEPGNEGDCKELDSDEWRSVTCANPFIKSHVDYTAEQRWEGLHVDDAWAASQAYIQCRHGQGSRDDSFSNVISDFFHAENAFHCDVWNADTNGCSGGSSKCVDVERSPVGSFILDSFKRIFGVNWSLYNSFGDVSSLLDIATLASDFGISPQDKASNFPLSIVLDILMLGFGFVMGPMWNKVIIPKVNPAGKPDIGSLKDTVNDAVKNSVTLGKDLFTKSNTIPPKDEVGLQTAIRSSFLGMVEAWRESIGEMNRIMFNGSPSSVLMLEGLMAGGRMLDREVIEKTEVEDLQKRLKRVMSAYMIPLTWRLSPEVFWPIIITEKLACDEAPAKDWTGFTWSYMTFKAYGKRYCKDGESFWLVGPKDYKKTCKNTDQARCDGFDVPPGFDSLVETKYGVSLDDVILGSINTWEANGRKNLERTPGELTTELLNNILDHEITTPNVFDIPICGMEEAILNWYEAYNGWVQPGPNFPCND
ncbi:uncharacterized protein DNG_00014 [Cephalotrichum gorgonifer]|uniref:SGNH hydrolase-type esterase domain-containing protein n=1 Tax=Cephalotrichum gorgonifer TaxID=2041049 RepID=A0AAE8MN59_9PEZI|nr:uncharacterized protein DNG_00014 [Cephalotrichum gorgonifer]